jgi:hypothetical protein
MSSFPRLKTGALAQYPATRRRLHETEVHRFVDGAEQAYRASAGRFEWVIRLDLLDETELAALQEFVVSMQGRFGSFSFEDPWDETVHADCSLEQDELVIDLAGERRSAAVLVIREN